jgi:hypothetical protein
LRLVGPLTLAAAFGMGSLPALAQSAPTMANTDCSAIHFELANPSPGSRVEMGNTIVEGVATDTRAPDGLGIDRIDFFLDSRDQGGTNIGTAIPTMVPAPFGRGSFEATVAFPNTAGGHDLVAYAHSAVTGQESIIAVPIAVGEDTSTAGLNLATGETQTCTQGGNLSMTPNPPTTTTPPATTPSTTTTTPAAPTTMMSPAAATLMFEVGNPSPGDTVHVGGINIDGVAWDRAATQGSGIDRVDIFLDNRDAGGMVLGEGTPGQMNTWHAMVTLPSNQTGLHNLSFYAHSSVTGQEMLITVPVTIAP